MRICLDCKQRCYDDTLSKCSKCNGELIPYSEEKYKYFLNNQKQMNSKWISKEDRLYKDIHTIRNILVAFVIGQIIVALWAFLVYIASF